MMKNRTALIRICLVAYFLVLAVIVFLADRKGTRYMLSFVRGIPYGDKLGHLLLMGGFAFFANLAFPRTAFRAGFVRIAWGAAIVALIVLIEEISQLFISGRSFDLGDLFFDLLGILVLGGFGRRLGLKLSGVKGDRTESRSDGP